MRNQQTRNLLQFLNGVNFPSFNDNIQEEVNVEQVKRDYLLGRMITDILEEDIDPKVKKHKLEELNGKTSRQLWQMVKWAKKVEYGASEEEYEAIAEQHRGELQPITTPEMRLMINYFTNEVKQKMDGIRRASATYNYSSAETPRTTSLKTRVLDVLVHYFPEDEGELRQMSLENLKGHLANLVEQVGNPELVSLHRNVRHYLKSKKPVKTSVVNLQSKLQYVLPQFANGNRQRFAAMTLPELQAELRTLMMSTENAEKKEEIRLALQEGKGTKTVPSRQVTRPGTRWTMTKAKPKSNSRKTRRSKHRK